MKKRKWTAIFWILPIFALGLVIGCAGSGDGDGDDFPAGYHVQCTIGGTTFNFAKGSTDGEPVAHIVKDWMYFHSTTEDLLQADLDALNGHVIALDWAVAGAAPGLTGTFTLQLIHYVDQSGNEFTGTGSVTILKYDAVGGDVEATFSGSITPVAGGAAVAVTDGTFRIKRIS